MKNIRFLSALLVIGVLLSACTPNSVIPATGQTATPLSTGVSDPTAAPSSTPFTSPTVTPVGSPTETPALATPTGETQPTPAPDVTRDDNNKTITLAVNQTFLLKLGEGYVWSIDVADQSVVSRLPQFAVIRGAQGIYKAHVPGQTTLTAQGDPTCRQEKPACASPTIQFKVTIIVK